MRWNRYTWGGLLTAVAIGVAVGVLRSRCHHIDGVSATDQLLQSVAMASEQFRMEFGTWPTSLSDLTNNAKGIAFIKWGNGGPVDPWGNRLLYLPFNREAGCGVVISLGADGKSGGVKHARDRVLQIGNGGRLEDFGGGR